MKNTIEQGQKFRREGINHLVKAHGCYEGAFLTSNFLGGNVTTHTIDEAVRDSLKGYAIIGALVVGAKGRACGTCRRILAQGRPRFEAATVYGRGYMRLAGWDGFEGLCCNSDPENFGRPFPSSI